MDRLSRDSGRIHAGQGDQLFREQPPGHLCAAKYAMRNPKKFAGYGRFSWGITASDGPGPSIQRINGKRVKFHAYLARAIPFGPDDGTLSPWAVAASLPFAPEVVLPTLRRINEDFPEITSKYGFKCSYNPTFNSGGQRVGSHRDTTDWTRARS